MRTNILALRKNNIKFYEELILELGLLRKKNLCAMCFKIIKIKDYHIQMCKNCRLLIMERGKK